MSIIPDFLRVADNTLYSTAVQIVKSIVRDSVKIALFYPGNKYMSATNTYIKGLNCIVQNMSIVRHL